MFPLPKDVPDAEAALQGACDIVAETWSEDLPARQWLLEEAERSELKCVVRKGKSEEGARFQDYFDTREKIARMPSHRFLAMRRGVEEGILKVDLALDDESVVRRLKSRFIQNPAFELKGRLEATVEDCYERLMHPQRNRR